MWLVEQLRQRGRVDVAAAAAQFGTAEMTIRRDLDALAPDGNGSLLEPSRWSGSSRVPSSPAPSRATDPRMSSWGSAADRSHCGVRGPRSAVRVVDRAHPTRQAVTGPDRRHLGIRAAGRPGGIGRRDVPGRNAVATLREPTLRIMEPHPNKCSSSTTAPRTPPQQPNWAYPPSPSPPPARYTTNSHAPPSHARATTNEPGTREHPTFLATIDALRILFRCAAKRCRSTMESNFLEKL